MSEEKISSTSEQPLASLTETTDTEFVRVTPALVRDLVFLRVLRLWWARCGVMWRTGIQTFIAAVLTILAGAVVANLWPSWVSGGP